MRILHLVESHTVHTDRILRHQTAAGHEASLITFHDFVKEGPVLVVPIPRVLARMPYHHHWNGLLEVARLVRSYAPDVVHGHYITTAALYLLASQISPVIGSAVGSDILVDTQAIHARILVGALGRWVDGFTSVAPHVTRMMVGLGIPKGRIVTFPWGVDTELFRPAEEIPRLAAIVSTRSFEQVYDLPTLIRAFAVASLARENVRLRLFGDGSLRAEMVRLAASLGVGDHVEFPGHVKQVVLAKALRKASVYVSTSTSDGASVSLLEAMASGLVPVVTDIEANRDWIRNEDNGLLFPVGDSTSLSKALRRAFVDEDLLDRCRRTNPTIVRDRASWGYSMRRLDDVYMRVSA